MVLVDKDCCDGDGSFNPGDNTVTAYKITQCGIPVYKCKNWGCPDPEQCYTAFHHKNVLFGTPRSKNGTRITTGTANWSGSSMGGGVGNRSYTPVNAETQLFLANDTVLFTRLLSNALYLIRSYEYQQACPYPGPNKTVETDQCAGSPRNPFNQPNWTQPNYTTIFADLSQLVTWPSVNVTFAVVGLAPSDAVYIFVRSTGATVGLNFDADSQAWLGELPLVKMGAIVDYDVYANEQVVLHPKPLITDPAFDWSAQTRRSDVNILTSSLTVVLHV